MRLFSYSSIQHKMMLQEQLSINVISSSNILLFFFNCENEYIRDTQISTLLRIPLFPQKMPQHSFYQNLQKLVQYNYRKVYPIMEINSKQRQIQNLFQRYQVEISLPFSIKSNHSRKGHRYDRDGHWNEKERLKYSVFLSFFHEILQDPLKKKRVRIYDMMSDMIVTRNSNQCRSHHQKMEKYRSNATDIVASVAEKYEPSVYDQHQRRYFALIKTLLQNSNTYIRTSTQTTYKTSQKKMAAAGRTTEDRNKSYQEQDQEQREDEFPQELLPDVKCENKPSEGSLVDKKWFKKTADSYEEKKPNKDEMDVPMMGIDGLSDQENKDQEPLELQQDIADPDQPHPSQIIAAQQPINRHYLDQGRRIFYEQQVASLELRRHWHVRNAEQLYSQWSSQIHNIKLCDQSIQFYSQLLTGDRSSSQRA